MSRLFSEPFSFRRPSRKARPQQRSRRSLHVDSLERREMMTATPVDFDFGTATSPLASGATRVTNTSAYSASIGYGWDATTNLTSLDDSEGGTFSLQRDFVKGTTAREFRVDLANGAYDVKLVSGSAGSYQESLIQFKLEGSVVANVDTVGGQLYTGVFRVTVSDGQLTLAVDDLGASSDWWMVNGLSITPASDPTPPSPLTSAKFDFGTDTSPVASGYTGVNRFTIYSPAQQYGWDHYTPINHLTTTTGTDDVRRDNVRGSNPGRFVVDVANGTYDVTLTSGSIESYQQSDVQWKLEGQVVDTIDTSPTQLFVGTYRVTVADGQLTLDVDDLGASSDFWLLTGLVIQPASDPTPPAPLTSLQVDFGTETSPVAAGYVGANRFSIYTPAQQFGWDQYTPINHLTTTTGTDDVRRDNVRGSGPGRFVADMANGDYDVTITSGSNNLAQNDVQLSLEGSVVANYGTSAGQYFVDTYRVTVSDGQLTLDLEDLGTTSDLWLINGLNIQPAPNAPPEAIDDYYGRPQDSVTLVPEDTTTTIAAPGVLANDTDPDGHTLSASQNSAYSAYGAIVTVNTNGSFSYDPRTAAVIQALPAGATYQDTFAYTASDGHGGTDTAVVQMTVTGTNDAPIVSTPINGFSVSEDSLPVEIPLGDHFLDIDSGTSLTYGVVSISNASIATATIEGDNLILTFLPDRNGDVAFEIAATDGITSLTTSFVVSVGSINDPVIASDDYVPAIEDTTFTIDVLANDTDADGDSLAIESTTSPSHGHVAISAEQLVYTPDANFFGTDSFTYTVTDSHGTHDTASVTIAVGAINDSPYLVGAAPSVRTTQDSSPTSLDLSEYFSDADLLVGDSLTYSIEQNPDASLALATIVGNILTIQLEPRQQGLTTLTVGVEDQLGESTSAVITIQVDPPPAVFEGGSLTLTSDWAHGGIAVGSEIVAGTAYVRVNGAPLGGDSDIPAASITDLVLQGTDGDDIFDLSGVAADAFSGLARIEGHGYGGNDSLTGSDFVETFFGDAGDDVLRGAGGNDTLLGGLGGDSLVGGAGDDVLNAGDTFGADASADTIYGGVGNDDISGLDSSDYWNDYLGDNVVSDGNASYSNAGGYGFGASAGTGGGGYGEDDPLSDADHYEAWADATLTISANMGVLANDGNQGSGLTATVTSLPEHGTLEFASDGSFVYHSMGNFVGMDEFTYQAFDGVQLGGTTTVAIAVGRVKMEYSLGRNNAWEDITQMSRTVWVGEHIWLRAKVDGPVNARFQWSIPLQKVRGYLADLNESVVNPFVPQNLTTAATDFYWIEKGTNQSVSVAAGLGQGNAENIAANFTVKRPDINVISITDDISVQEGPGPNNIGTMPWLKFGTGEMHGIDMDPGILLGTPPGQLQWLRTVNSTVTRVSDSSGVYSIRQGTNRLDTLSLLGFFNPKENTTWDSPGIGLASEWRYVERRDEFTDYVMWMSFTPTSIPVPLRAVDWFWEARAESADGVSWNKTYSDHSLNPADRDVNTYPTWKGHVLQLPMQRDD